MTEREALRALEEVWLMSAILTLLYLVLLPAVAWSQETISEKIAAVPTVTPGEKFVGYDWQTLLTPVIIVVIPIAVNYIKQIPWLLTHKAWLPVIAVVISVSLNFLAAAATDSRIGPVLGITLGLAAVGLRELYSQWFGAEAARAAVRAGAPPGGHR